MGNSSSNSTGNAISGGIGFLALLGTFGKSAGCFVEGAHVAKSAVVAERIAAEVAAAERLAAKSAVTKFIGNSEGGVTDANLFYKGKTMAEVERLGYKNSIPIYFAEEEKPLVLLTIEEEPIYKRLADKSLNYEASKLLKHTVRNCVMNGEVERLENSVVRYKSLREKLRASFGEKSKLVEKFEVKFFNTIAEGNIRESVDISVKELIPLRLSELPNTPEFNDVYSLLSGSKLTQKQALLLSDITGRSLEESSNKFDQYILIKEGAGHFSVSTTSSIKTVKNYQQTLSKVSLRNKYVIIDGDLNDNFAKYLAKHQISCVGKYETFLKNQRPSEIEIIYVASTDKQKLVNMFGVSEDQANELSNIFSKVIGLPKTKIVSDKGSLLSELAVAKINNKDVVVVFNNNNGFLFEEPIANFDIANPITCNSYSVAKSQFAYQTTDFIYVEDVVKSLTQTIEDKNILSINDAYFKFSINYNKALSKRQNKIFATVGIGATAGGTAIGAYYYQTNKK